MSKADIKESIAGYYYQFLLATLELINLYINDKQGSVAVERGADVRVQDDDDLFLEAKFYGREKFTKKDAAITRTVYNFAVQYKKKLQKYTDLTNVNFQFKTNIMISDILFFHTWKKDNCDKKMILRYVQYCLIKESGIVKTTSYEEIMRKINDDEIQDNIREEANLSNDEILSYASKLEFISSQYNEPKLLTEKKLREEIEKKITRKTNIDKETAQKVINIIIEKFFKTTLTELNESVSVDFIDEVINHDKDYKIDFLNDSKIVEHREIIEETIEDYSMYLDAIDVPTKDFNEIIIDLRENMKVLTSRLLHEGFDNALHEYLLTEENPNTRLVIELLQPFSEFIVKTDKKYGATKLNDLKGINNIGFTIHSHEYLIQSGVNSNVNRLRDRIFQKFFTKVINNKQIQHINKADAVYFKSDEAIKKPCEIDKKKLLSMIPDITEPKPELLQSYFIAQDYRCSHCLEYQNNECHYSINLDKERNL